MQRYTPAHILAHMYPCKNALLLILLCVTWNDSLTSWHDWLTGVTCVRAHTHSWLSRGIHHVCVCVCVCVCIVIYCVWILCVESSMCVESCMCVGSFKCVYLKVCLSCAYSHSCVYTYSIVVHVCILMHVCRVMHVCLVIHVCILIHVSFIIRASPSIELLTESQYAHWCAIKW